MVQLSESQLATIRAHPIKDDLDAFRDAFESAHLRTSPQGSIDRFQQLVAEPAERSLVLKFIHTLSGHPAATNLRSHDEESPLLSDLAMLYIRLSTNETDVKHTAQLVMNVVAGEDDPTIWVTIYDLIYQTKPAPPPILPLPTAFSSKTRPTTPQPTPSATPSFQQTPWSYKSSSIVSTTETRNEVDLLLKFEVEENLVIDHPGVFDSYFRRVAQLADIAVAVFDACKVASPPMYIDGVGWTDWPLNCKQDEVLDFLRRHIEQFLSLAGVRGFQPSQRRRCVTTPNQPPEGSIAKRKPDFNIVCSKPEEEETPCHWSNILVPGELKTNPAEDNYNSTWLQISRYAREVFSAQDTRRFVLGFTLCGSLLRLWEFDRLGVMASKSFDINKDGHRFVSVILGYLWMNEEELGFDPTIMEDNDGRYMEIERNERAERIYIEKLMMRQRLIAGRATTCWKGRVGDKSGDELVIKDSWEHEERPEEGLLLEEATKAGVENVARYYHHETVRVRDAMDDIRESVRRGLSDAEGRDLTRQPRSAVLSAVTSAVTSNNSELERGRSGSSSRGGSKSRGGSQGRGSKTRHGNVSKKRTSIDVNGSMPPPPLKRSCPDLTTRPDGVRRRNRVHRRVIMRDIGKILYQASSLRAMLTGLLGGIKGHESLFNTKILHRDISIGNVLLNEVEDDGFLIDLDLAVKTGREKASGAPNKTGTKVFMAIGALYGEEHSFMHDLESFFWLLFWICIHWNGLDQQLSRSEHDHWNSKDIKELAREKAGLVLKENVFNMEVDETFTPYCRLLIPCIRNLRRHVFLNGKSWDRMEQENRGLYSQMKVVLEEARQDLSIIE